MTEQGRQAALSRQLDAAARADRVLVEALLSAHAATVEGIGRLEAIAAEIESAARNQAALAVDTPAGAREFQTFLIAKQREIIAVVSGTHELDGATRAVLETLRARYAG